ESGGGSALRCSCWSRLAWEWSVDSGDRRPPHPSRSCLGSRLLKTSGGLDCRETCRGSRCHSTTLGNGRSYDVAADGRFLINVSPSASPLTPLSAPITVIVNWQEELKQRVPTK